MKRTSSIDKILRPLETTPFQAYLSNAVQVADILDWILSQVGVSEIWQTSFSISEEFLRRLYFITKNKKVSRINLVLDHKATNKTLKLWAFITQVIERTYLADNHSKILLVQSESGHKVSVITSQNLTRGNRHESAFISTDPVVFATLHAQVSDLITNHSVPLNDLFRQRVTAD
ncbi:MAG: C4-dicarboxylate ABC transporter [Muribaculaceae bacterium]|nr:C4-dicarboxylate ABC transporter [Muribaculaceae bacterium]